MNRRLAPVGHNVGISRLLYGVPVDETGGPIAHANLQREGWVAQNLVLAGQGYPT